jgi:hypothetical protein
LETESENKGYISSELSDLNNSGAEEIEAVDRVNDGVAQGKFVRGSSGMVVVEWFESMACEIFISKKGWHLRNKSTFLCHLGYLPKNLGRSQNIKTKI